MGWFSRFGLRKKSTTDPSTMPPNNDPVTWTPKGALDSAMAGADLRVRFLELTRQFEERGDRSYRVVTIETTGEEVLIVNDKFKKFLNQQPDAFDLKLALQVCNQTLLATQGLNEEWPQIVAEYARLPNTEDVLRVKCRLLAIYLIDNIYVTEMLDDFNHNLSETIASNSNISEFAGATGLELEYGNLSEDQLELAKLEFAPLLYRIVDELAFKYLGSDRELFMGFFEDDIAFDLALQGFNPSYIDEILITRTQEYAQYQKWMPKEGEAKGKLLWEAALHIGNPLGFDINPIFLVQFAPYFMERLQRALIPELLSGDNTPNTNIS